MKIYKIAVTVPENEADALRKVIGDAGAGKIGNYTHCSFSIKGFGRFMPVSGADPAIGEVGKLEAVAEERIEVVCEKKHVEAVVTAIRKNHPYEEPAIEVYKLEQI